MSKRALKKSKRRSKAVVPALGMTGLSLSLASGATASISEATTNVPSTSQPHELFLGEEEIFDVSLSEFYVFDKENAGAPSLAQKLKLARGGGCGCGGHGGCGGCGGHGGCAAGARVGCAGGVRVACAGGVRVACAGGVHVHCRCAFFRRCFGCGCSGCGGCGGWGCGTCWIWTPNWGWVNTCWAESTPAGEESRLAESTPAGEESRVAESKPAGEESRVASDRIAQTAEAAGRGD